MKIVSTVARILLGVMFTVFGLNGFLHFIPSPAFPPGYLLDFLTAVGGSGYYVLIFGVQLICGIMLLTGQYVPLAIVALILWFLTAWPIRAQFAPIFARKANV